MYFIISMSQRRAAIVSHYVRMSVAFLQVNAELPVPPAVRRKKRWWVREIFKDRESQGDANNLVKEMMITDLEGFYNYARMSKTQFERLLSLVSPHLSKLSIRKPICEQERLLVTLRFELRYLKRFITQDEYLCI